MAELRKLLNLSLALLLCCGQGWCTWSLVQKSGNTTTSASPFTVSLSGTVAGHPIVVIVNSRSGSGISVSDGVNTYSSTTLCNNGGNEVQFFYVTSGVGGNLTITVSYTTGNNIYANAREYSGSGTITFDGAACTTAPGSTSTPSSDSITTTGNDVLIGGMTDFNATSGGCGTGWNTSCSGNTNPGAIVDEQGDDLNQTAGSYSAQFTLGSAQSDWMVGIMALKESSGGSPPAAINKQRKIDQMEGMVR
jgi:hypothetical protein